MSRPTNDYQPPEACGEVPMPAASNEPFGRPAPTRIRIRVLRVNHRMTRAEVAKGAHIGVTRLGEIERGSRRATQRDLEAILHAIGASREEFERLTVTDDDWARVKSFCCREIELHAPITDGVKRFEPVDPLRGFRREDPHLPTPTCPLGRIKRPPQ